jgi:hypothetical protein
MKKWYIVTAEHCSGASVGHPCKRGIWEDPTATMQYAIVAQDEKEAERLAHEWLDAEIEGWPARCPCGRPQIVGSVRWWNSVAFTAERLEGEE